MSVRELWVAGVILVGTVGLAQATNIAPLATGDVSSVYGTYSSAGLNNNAYTWADTDAWCSSEVQAEPQWATLTWSTAVTFDEVSVYHIGSARPEFASLNTSDYTIQTWDGADWVTQASVVGNTAGVVSSTFAPVTTTALRLYITKAAQQDGGDYDMARIMEVTVSQAVPEPMTIALLASGLAFMRRRVSA
jgi:hypothetical protein